MSGTAAAPGEPAPALVAFFALLSREGSAPASLWPAELDPGTFGLDRQGDVIRPVAAYDPLRRDAIEKALSPRARSWLRHLDVRPVIGSTNATLMDRAQQGSVDGWVCIAELQLAGRGRRGRSWFSPFGANLALSLGLELARPAAALGGVSSVVGLAVLDALEQLGVTGLALKWPNDLLVGEAKLGGILIEMTQARGVTTLVVGIGLNVALPPRLRAELDQAVADLASQGPPPQRSLLAGKVVASVVAFMDAFAVDGFAPFKEAFDLRHRYHGQPVEIVQGETRLPGQVLGVADSGGLLLATRDGVREFHGGEVSMRHKPES